jgi:hypothetical protein
MIEAARRYLEARDGKPVDARYSVTRTKEGYNVLVEFVGGYENGRPLFYPGGHCILVLRRDGSVVRYMPGE